MRQVDKERGLVPVGGKPKPIRIKETGEVFTSVSHCARAIRGHASAISDVINGYRGHHKGYTFERVEEC